jgi:HPt (histidine-containing phosphotransfer) domain-containing protein
MHRFAAFVLIGTAALLAQDPAPVPAPVPAKKPASRPVLVDRVVATVNDASILMSELTTLGAGMVRSREALLERDLLPAERLSLYKAVLDQRIENHAMAQAAKTFGFATPEQIDALFEDEMKRDEEEQLRDLGTWQELSKELERVGRTWQSYVRERRVEKMRQFAEEFAVGMRLQKQGNLFLTPRMLRETFQREIATFVHGPRAGVILVTFEGPDARAQAEAAAALWQKEDIDGRELVKRFPDARATQKEIGGITEEARESLAPQIADLALAGPLNHVSEPFELGGLIRIVKVAVYEPARSGKFEDADVQNSLREICYKGVVTELRRQAVERAMQRTEFWKTQELR